MNRNRHQEVIAIKGDEKLTFYSKTDLCKHFGIGMGKLDFRLSRDLPIQDENGDDWYVEYGHRQKEVTDKFQVIKQIKEYLLKYGETSKTVLCEVTKLPRETLLTIIDEVPQFYECDNNKIGYNEGLYAR